MRKGWVGKLLLTGAAATLPLFASPQTPQQELDEILKGDQAPKITAENVAATTAKAAEIYNSMHGDKGFDLPQERPTWQLAETWTHLMEHYKADWEAHAETLDPEVQEQAIQLSNTIYYKGLVGDLNTKWESFKTTNSDEFFKRPVVEKKDEAVQIAAQKYTIYHLATAHAYHSTLEIMGAAPQIGGHPRFEETYALMADDAVDFKLMSEDKAAKMPLLMAESLKAYTKKEANPTLANLTLAGVRGQLEQGRNQLAAGKTMKGMQTLEDAVKDLVTSRDFGTSLNAMSNLFADFEDDLRSNEPIATIDGTEYTFNQALHTAIGYRTLEAAKKPHIPIPVAPAEAEIAVETKGLVEREQVTAEAGKINRNLYRLNTIRLLVDEASGLDVMERFDEHIDVGKLLFHGALQAESKNKSYETLRDHFVRWMEYQGVKLSADDVTAAMTDYGSKVFTIPNNPAYGHGSVRNYLWKNTKHGKRYMKTLLTVDPPELYHYVGERHNDETNELLRSSMNAPADERLDAIVDAIIARQEAGEYLSEGLARNFNPPPQYAVQIAETQDSALKLLSEGQALTSAAASETVEKFKEQQSQVFHIADAVQGAYQTIVAKGPEGNGLAGAESPDQSYAHYVNALLGVINTSNYIRETADAQLASAEQSDNPSLVRENAREWKSEATDRRKDAWKALHKAKPENGHQFFVRSVAYDILNDEERALDDQCRAVKKLKKTGTLDRYESLKKVDCK